MNTKRQNFLESFLGALGAKQIIWTAINENSISGTVVYDPNHHDERQDFIWHMIEENVPNDQVTKLIHFLIDNNLLNGDKLKFPITEIELPDTDDLSKEKHFNELFNVLVNMIDNQKETDFFFIHE